MSSAAREQELVKQLREVSGIEAEDARRLLEATDWVVADAVALHFATDGDEAAVRHDAGQAVLPSAPQEPSGPTGAVEAVGAVAERETAPAAEQPEEAPGWLDPLSKAFTYLGQAVMGVASEDFDQWFATRYGAPAPSFHKDTFAEAVRSALADGKLMLLWFHQEESPATERLCRDVLQSELVLPLLERSFVLWAGDVCRFEPSQIAKLIGAPEFPTLVVCQPLRNGYDFQGFGMDNFVLEWPLGTFAQPIYRLCPPGPGEPLNADEVIAALTSASEDHQEAARSRQADIDARNSHFVEERRLREEQDREFQESLLMDQMAASERARANDEAAASMSSSAPAKPAEEAAAPQAAAAAAEAAAAARARAEEEAERQREAEEAERQRVARGAEIRALPEPEPAGSSTAKLQLRLPSGERLQRVFLAGQRLEEVFEWAHCCRTVAKPLRFELRMSYPAVTLNDRSATVEESGLVPSAALVMKAED